MLSDKFLEKVFCHKLSKTVPIGYQQIMLDVFREVLEDLKGENPYAAISELLDE